MRWLVSWPVVWGIVVLVLLMAWAVIEMILDALASAWRRRVRRYRTRRDKHVLRESHDAAIDRLVRDIDADYEQRMGGRR